jgi:hypothetical protein
VLKGSLTSSACLLIHNLLLLLLLLCCACHSRQPRHSHDYFREDVDHVTSPDSPQDEVIYLKFEEKFDAQPLQEECSPQPCNNAQ